MGRLVQTLIKGTTACKDSLLMADDVEYGISVLQFSFEYFFHARHIRQVLSIVYATT